jgi:hypothetical protein
MDNIDLYHKVISIENGRIKEVLTKNEWYIRYWKHYKKTKIFIYI